MACSSQFGIHVPPCDLRLAKRNLIFYYQFIFELFFFYSIKTCNVYGGVVGGGAREEYREEKMNKNIYLWRWPTCTRSVCERYLTEMRFSGGPAQVCWRSKEKIKSNKKRN